MEETQQLERRIDHLADQVSYLLTRMDKLSTRIAALEQGKVAIIPEDTQHAAMGRRKLATDPEKVWTTVGSGALLPRVAAVCFMLVVALMLRTITDEGFIDQQPGALIGLAYGAGLIAWGWCLYATGKPTAPVFPVCGAALLYTIIIETHGHFASLSTSAAFTALFVTQAVLAGMGLRFRRASLLHVGVLGAGSVAIAINFPWIHFLPAAIVIWTGNLIALHAHRKKTAPSLKWFALFLSALFWLLWTLKLSVPLAKHQVPMPSLAYGWFFPSLAMFGLLYFASTLLRVLEEERPLGFFHGMLPTITVLFCFLGAYGVLSEIPEYLLPLGVITTVIAAIHYLAAWFVAGRHRKGAPGCNAFSFAGTLVLTMGLPLALGLIKALPFLSVIALCLAVIADRWRSGGVRFTSYLLQGTVCTIVLTTMPRQLEIPMPSAVAAATLFLAALLQYQWCRNHRPPIQDSAYFAWLDRRDAGAIILLLSGLIGAFGIMRLGLSVLLGEGMRHAFYCGQTIIINTGAVVLLLVGGRRRDRELLIVALAVILLGAIKVFFFDLFKTTGLPLVTSVFSFGVVALVGSMVLRRYQAAGDRQQLPSANAGATGQVKSEAGS